MSNCDLLLHPPLRAPPLLPLHPLVFSLLFPLYFSFFFIHLSFCSPPSPQLSFYCSQTIFLTFTRVNKGLRSFPGNISRRRLINKNKANEGHRSVHNKQPQNKDSFSWHMKKSTNYRVRPTCNVKNLKQNERRKKSKYINSHLPYCKYVKYKCAQCKGQITPKKNSLYCAYPNNIFVYTPSKHMLSQESFKQMSPNFIQLTLYSNAGNCLMNHSCIVSM